jgi:hypothetical protein
LRRHKAAEAAVAPLGYTVIQPERGYAQTAQELVLEQDIGTLGFEDRVMTYDAYQTYAAAIGCQLVPVKDAFEVLREVNEQAEVDCIVAAQRIAEAAHVSCATVSRCLSGREGVGEKTRERVLRICRDMGYSPNFTEAAPHRTGRIGFPVPSLRDPETAALAACLEADRCQIFTDVDGVYDRDPRIHPDARRFGRISYGQMLALVENGAQVLHDRSVELAREHGILVVVLSAFTGGPGTVVG